MFLGSPHYPEHVFEHLNDLTYAERFGDIRLIFEGGEVVDYYRALLSLLSWEWSQLLQEAPFTDTVLLPDMAVREFFNPVPLTQELSASQEFWEMEVYDETENKALEDADKFLTTINEDILNNFVEDEEENPAASQRQEEVLIHIQVVNLSGQSGPAYLPGILADFSWPDRWPGYLEGGQDKRPGDLAGPGHHSMGWRKAPGQAGELLKVMGNRSLHTVVAKQGGLPELAAFLLPHLEEPANQLGGILHIRDFINGQAATSCAAFQLEGQGARVSLDDLLKLAGHELPSREGPGYNDVVIKVLVYMGSNTTNLNVLVDGWKHQLLQDTKGKLLEPELNDKVNVKAVISWLRSQCLKTIDGSVLCCYCGFICYKQASLGNFNSHMRTHLFRPKKNNKKRSTKNNA